MATRKKTARKGAKRGGRRTTKKTARKTAKTSATKTAKRAVAKPAQPHGGLATYNAKRDFTRTAEPPGRARRGRKTNRLEFVIQKHAASHLHFDVRLELDGAMKSWAVPKGPHYDPSVRRLAMEVEDHPMDYNSFEGTIPQGEYGGGTVMIWDRGWYEPETEPAEDETAEDVIRAGYEKGDLKIVMHGRRMRGGWVLVRMRRPESRGKPQWLLIKHRDRHARDDGFDVVAEKMRSVVSRRSMERIAADG